MNKLGSRHLSYEERVVIEKLKQSGYSLRKIAAGLGRSPNTVCQELKRNRVQGQYQAGKAKHKAWQRRSHSKWQCLKDLDQETFIRAKLGLGWSPERIAGRLTKLGFPISPKAVYKFVYSRCLEHLLWRPKAKRKKASYLTGSRKFIEARPLKPGLDRFEADFVVCQQNSFCLLVLVEKQSRFSLVRLLPDKKKATLFQVFHELTSQVKIRELLTDNDLAFNCWPELEQRFGLQVYFTHPYCSWKNPW